MHECFDKTLKRYKITAKQVADISGVSQGYISQFRNGTANPTVDMVEKMIKAVEQIEPSARVYFANQIAGDQLFNSVLKNLDEKDIALVLLEVVARMKAKDNKSLTLA